MKKWTLAFFVCITFVASWAQPEPHWSARMAATLMEQHRDSFCYDKSKPARWDYELGLYLKSLEQLWRQTGDGRYFKYIQQQVDRYVQDDGSIRTYDLEAFNIDHVAPGRPVLLLWQQTGKDKYRKAAQLLREQLARQPRTKEGGFWHKKRYPWQMWLDGLYMGEPYYAEYSLLFDEAKNFDDIANQFIYMYNHALDAKTGLLYHGWDESREQRWASKTTGQSPNFWGRAMGWYMMGLVDVLDYIPQDHAKRGQLVKILQDVATAIVKVQDPESGVWYQVLDKAGQSGNYREASASCMFTYAMLKGTRMGYLDAGFREAGKKAYAGILKTFIKQGTDGWWHLDKVCSVAGLGGNPYRDGSYQYYISEPTRPDDIKGAGPFILASVEMEQLGIPQPGAGKTVLLDRYFNNEYRDGARFHYTWEDLTNSGYAWWGQAFRDFGAATASLDDPPTADNLKNAAVYIIVDPDTKKETADPHFIEKKDIENITAWVKQGGTLVVLANDTSNCEIPHFNQLASAFGIQFSNKNRNMVVNDQFEQGAVMIPSGHHIFGHSRKIYIKEISVLDIKEPAQAALTEGGDVIMATTTYGKGRVFALGDPWLYNEYVDGKKLPSEYDNLQAGRDLAAWLLRTPEQNAVSEAETALVQAVEALRQALVSGEQTALENIVTDELSYGHSSGKIEDKKAFIESLTSGRSDFTAIDLTNQTITVSGSTAYVRHVLSAQTNDAGKGPGSIQLSILLVWVKQAGAWKLLARQAVKI